MKNTNDRISALANYLDCFEHDITLGYRENLFEVNGKEYFVLTDSESDEKAKEYICDSLWAFKSSFILEQCGMKQSSAPIDSLSKMQEKTCEDCNDFIRALIDGTCGIDKFVQSAIEADGRWHFIAMYDGCENESGDFYIYRMN